MRTLIVSLWLGFVAGALAADLDDRVRTWTDATGQFTVDATLIGAKDGQFQLRRADGRVVSVPATRLSPADQQYVRERLAAARPTPAPKPVAGGARKPVAGSKPAPGPWPWWRGPNHDGLCTETGLLDTWPQDGPPLLWKVDGLGGGYSSLTVGKGLLFTMGKKGNETHLLALAADDGSEKWSTPIDTRGDDPNCTPTFDGEFVFGVSHRGKLACVAADSGRLVWEHDYGNDFGGRMMSSWGFSESPFVDGDRLICTPGGERALLAALERRTGKMIWSTPMPNGGRRGQDGAGYSSVVPGNGAGVKQYVQLVGRGVIGVAADSGRPLWSYDRVANGTANVPTPIVRGDYVFCSSGYGDGGSALLKLSGGPRGIDVQEVYYKSNDELQNHHGGMLLVGNHLFFGHGHNNGFPVCVDFLTGQFRWEPKRGPGSGSAAVLFADGHLYFRYEDGRMALIEADPSAVKIKGQFRIPSNHGKHWAHPVIADGRLYLRDQEALLCFDVRKQ